MLRVGEQLYRPTIRDEQTLLIEPWFRPISGTIGAGNLTGSASIPVPVDRALYVHSAIILLEPVALSTWTNADLRVTDNAAVATLLYRAFGATGLIGERAAAASGAGVAVYLTVPLDIILPPQIAQLQLNVQRLVNTNAGTFQGLINAYLLPPGGIGRA